MAVEVEVVFYENPDGSWFADAPAVDGAFAGGSTRAAAIANVREALACAEWPRRGADYVVRERVAEQWERDLRFCDSRAH